MAVENRELARVALDACRALQVEYADVRWEHIIEEELSIADGTIEPIEHANSKGLGIRVIKNGAWGFAATDNPDEKTVKDKALLATEIAWASSKVNNNPVELASLEPVRGEYVSAHEIDPFEVPLAEKIEFLAAMDRAMAEGGGDKINSRNCFASFRKRYKYFVSSEGSEISQTLIHTGAGISIGQVKSHRDRFSRSYPSSSGQYETKGYELLEELKFEEAIPKLIDDIEALAGAEACPEKETALLLSGDQVSLQMHESIGHALELDRVFGAEKNFSGTSFATPDKLGKIQYGSDIVTVTSDPTVAHGLASFGYDDEGVPAHRAKLIDKGILVNYLSSRETAARIGKASTGAMRANSWLNVPIVRIGNINLAPGDKSFEQLLAGIDEGIYMDGVKSWSIDDERRYFQFGCQIGWLIKGGKLTTPIKNPTYSGCTTEFWNRCRGIADAKSYRIWGTPNCGKGQPGQNARTAQGASPALFDQVQVGG
jgi:TldD protein